MLEEIRLLRQKFERDLQDSLAKQAFERTTAVVNWLSPSHQEVSREHQRHTASRERNPGSCKWILKESAFQHWFDLIFCPTPMLWISGKPGSGNNYHLNLITTEPKANASWQANLCWLHTL